MDFRIRALQRKAAGRPNEDPERQAYIQAVRRIFIPPSSRFQADLAKGGPLERALMWELQKSRLSVQVREQGGLLTVSGAFGYDPTHIRVWYPLFEEVIESLFVADVRFTIAGQSEDVGEIAETLQDYFPSATAVSVGVARAQEDGPRGKGDLPKPKRRDDIDPQALKTEAMEGSHRRKLGNPMVG